MSARPHRRPELQPEAERHRLRPPSRRVLHAVLLVALVVAAAGVLQAVTGGEAFGVAEQAPAVAYLCITVLIAGDAVIPVLPGETTLNAASTVAASGELDLILVIIAGALGATVGDSALFWIARRNRRRIEPHLQHAKADQRVASALGYLGDNRKILLVFARYVPGLRFVVNATFGLSELPYRQFVPWSALGAILWATYTCLLAYWVGSTIEDYPLASMIVSGAITTALIAILFLRERKRRAHEVASQVPKSHGA
jgi:membrane protein DedA with SNARE-associated domain